MRVITCVYTAQHPNPARVDALREAMATTRAHARWRFVLQTLCEAIIYTRHVDALLERAHHRALVIKSPDWWKFFGGQYFLDAVVEEHVFSALEE